MNGSSGPAGSDADALGRLASLLNGGQRAEALRAAEAWLAERADHPLPLAVIASARLAQGRLEEAVALHWRRAQLSVTDPQAWAALAACLFQTRRIEESIEAWRRAVSLAPAEPGLACGLANALRSAGRGAEAEALFLNALAAAPGWFDAEFGLAMVALEAGRIEAACTRSESLIVRFPEAPAALWLAARTAMARGDFRAAEARAGGLSRQSGLGAEQTADALLLHGEALDRLDRTTEAFDSVRRGKALQRALHAERAAGREGEAAKYRRLATWFAEADPAAWRPVGDEGESPAAGHAFLVGFPRSGTTLLEQALAGHPGIVTLEEAPTLAEPYAEFMLSADGFERLAALSEADIAHWRARYWAAVAACGANTDGRLFVDKAPAGTLYLPLVTKLFPRARILFAVRDPRDVVLSCYRNNFGINAMTYAFTGLEDAAACYDACMTMAEVYRRVLPLDILDVRHEALVDDPQGGLASICAFLGIEPTDRMTDVAATASGRAVRTPSADQVREGFSRRGLGRWRLYADELAPVLPILAPWAERFGYPAG